MGGVVEIVLGGPAEQGVPRSGGGVCLGIQNPKLFSYAMGEVVVVLLKLLKDLNGFKATREDRVSLLSLIVGPVVQFPFNAKKRVRLHNRGASLIF